MSLNSMNYKNKNMSFRTITIQLIVLKEECDIILQRLFDNLTKKFISVKGLLAASE